jgi:hypothetical protein
MKQLTCVQLGGPATCTAVISGNTMDELTTNGMKHVEEAHPEMAADIKKMPKEELEKWSAEMQKKWDATPDK